MRFLRGDVAFAGMRGAYLCFVMIPVEERIGEWRYAGAAESQAGVLAALQSFQQALFGDWLPAGFSFADWVENMDMDLAGAWSYRYLPLEDPDQREHQVILFAEGGAPYDDAGLAILEIPSMAASPFAGRSPEIKRPGAWDGPDGDEDDEDLEDEG